MYNAQANRLNRLIMSSDSQVHNFLTIEPISIKKSQLRDMRVGGIIDIGDKMPKLYIYQSDIIVGQARLGESNGLKSIIISAKERMVSIKKAEPKYAILYCRMAIIQESDFTVSRLVTIAQDALENIVVLHNEKSIATAKLVRYGKRYALEIMELTDE